MKKMFLTALVAVLALGFAGTALVSANPFADVPAKHWAYDSIAELAASGIVDGYGDATFRGEKNITRYEMAQIVAKAIANKDKADERQKAVIDKLTGEFGDELKNLGVRVNDLESKVGKIKLSGEVRTRYESSADSADSPQSGTRLRLGIKAQLTDDLVFIGKYEAETPFGPAGSSNDNAHLTQANITGRALGFDLMILGRQHLLLGQGLLADADGPADGWVLGSFISGKKLLLVGGCLEAAGHTFLVSNIGYTPNKDFSISASFAKDNDAALYKSWAAGFTYKGIPDIGLTFEHGTNGADQVKTANAGSSAKAWMAKAKYLGADGAKPKSYGLWLGYREADPKFDTFGFTTLNKDYARAANTGGLTNDVGMLKNIKGFQYGVEYTVFENGIAKIIYNDLKDKKTGDVNAANLLCQLTYTF